MPDSKVFSAFETLFILQDVLQQPRNVAGNQVAGNPRRRPRMIVTKHPVVRSTKSKKAKSRKSLELDSDDGVELEFGDVDKTPSRKEYSRSTRRFSPLGFLMVLCTSGLDTVTTASDDVKVRIIKYLESQHGLLCTTGLWKELSEEDK